LLGIVPPNGIRWLLNQMIWPALLLLSVTLYEIGIRDVPHVLMTIAQLTVTE
jgi:hypothetical protein